VRAWNRTDCVHGFRGHIVAIQVAVRNPAQDFADVNQDTYPDLVVACAGTGKVAVILGAGNGTFSAPSYFLAGTRPVAVAIGDFNGDFRPDIVAANNTSPTGTLSILLASGSLGNFATPVSVSAGNGPRALAIGDFDRDGFSDIAVANQWGSDVSSLGR